MNLTKLLEKRTSPDIYVEHVHARKDYFDLPIEKRSRKVWYWLGPWYKLPMGLPMNMKSFMKKGVKSEWDLCYDELRKTFPLQVFIREDLRDLGIVWFFRMKYMGLKEFYRKWIKATFKPYNTTIVKTIPRREWNDLVSIIPNFLYACVIQFVEDEKCFEHTNWEGSTGSTDFENKLKEIYNFAKTGRAELEKRITEKLHEASEKDDDLSYEERYGEMNKLEEELKQKDKEYMTWVVEHVGHFWT